MQRRRGSANLKRRESGLTLWGWDVSCLSPTAQLLLLGSAMFTCQVLQGIFTEHVARGVLSGLMWAAAAIELTTYATLAAVELRLCKGLTSFSSIPWLDYIAVAICISLGRGLTWVGYGTLSYPTVLLFKSSKILVVMISGLVILGKIFKPAEYAAAILAVTGLYMFSSADMANSSKEGSDSLGGIGVICLAVICEATVSTLQERALRRDQRPLAEMIFVTNGLGAVLLYAIAAAKGEIHLLHSKLHDNPTVLLWLLGTVVLAYGGTYAFTGCIKGFGAVVATGLGIGRKFLSVLASYIIFPKPILLQHAVGVTVFFSGLIISWLGSWSSTSSREGSPPSSPTSPAMSPAAGESDSERRQHSKDLSWPGTAEGADRRPCIRDPSMHLINELFRTHPHAHHHHHHHAHTHAGSQQHLRPGPADAAAAGATGSAGSGAEVCGGNGGGGLFHKPQPQQPGPPPAGPRN